MNTTIQTQMGDDQNVIGARIIRWTKNNWILVAKGMTKDITRDEGLRIKNQYKMTPESTGYHGIVSLGEF